MRISFIGGGAMAEAMIAGVIEAGVTGAQQIRVGEPVEARRGYLQDTYSIETTRDNLDAVRGADAVILDGEAPADHDRTLRAQRPYQRGLDRSLHRGRLQGSHSWSTAWTTRPSSGSCPTLPHR